MHIGPVGASGGDPERGPPICHGIVSFPHGGGLGWGGYTSGKMGYIRTDLGEPRGSPLSAIICIIYVDSAAEDHGPKSEDEFQM